MGRIIHEVKISSGLNAEEFIILDAMVDTGASVMTLPESYKNRFTQLSMQEAECVTANAIVKVLVGGPFKISLTGFRSIFSEVAFLPGLDEPLIGYTVLEAIPAAVDMLGHRLVPIKYLDMK